VFAVWTVYLQTTSIYRAPDMVSDRREMPLRKNASYHTSHVMAIRVLLAPLMLPVPIILRDRDTRTKAYQGSPWATAIHSFFRLPLQVHTCFACRHPLASPWHLAHMTL